MSEPSSLTDLLAWFRTEVEQAIPQRIHSRDTAEDGDPEWHAAFRAWLTMHPATEDRDGELRSPLRYALWVMGGPGAESQGPDRRTRRGAYLTALAALDFDWRRCAGLWGILNEQAAYDYTRESLRQLRAKMYDRSGIPIQPRRRKLAECRHEGCRQRTDRRFCRDHAA